MTLYIIWQTGGKKLYFHCNKNIFFCVIVHCPVKLTPFPFNGQNEQRVLLYNRTCCFITQFSHLTDSRMKSAIDWRCLHQKQARSANWACRQDRLRRKPRGCRRESAGYGTLTHSTRKYKFHLAVWIILRKGGFEYARPVFYLWSREFDALL